MWILPSSGAATIDPRGLVSGGSVVQRSAAGS